jgi:hypothetical protein
MYRRDSGNALKKRAETLVWVRVRVSKEGEMKPDSPTSFEIAWVPSPLVLQRGKGAIASCGERFYGRL